MTFTERYGSWALITGASEGTGAAFAHRLASQGLNCILVARRHDPLARLASALRSQYPVECLTISTDLSAADAPSRVIDTVGERKVGLLVNNAGADSNGSTFLDAELKNWQQLAHLNMLTTLGLCHHFGGLMRERQRGGLLLVGSGACYGGMPGVAVYAGSKAFNLCFAEGLWAELKPHGVDVLNLILGRTDTPAHRQLMERLGQPMPEGLASPQQVAAVGLERLPHGPVHNWGLADEEAGYAPGSAAQRRRRVEAMSSASPATQGRA